MIYPGSPAEIERQENGTTAKSTCSSVTATSKRCPSSRRFTRRRTRTSGDGIAITSLISKNWQNTTCPTDENSFSPTFLAEFSVHAHRTPRRHRCHRDSGELAVAYAQSLEEGFAICAMQEQPAAAGLGH